MALSRRVKITVGMVGLTASALFATSGSAFAAGDEGGTDLVIVEQAQAPTVTVADTAGDCAHGGASASADTR
jgi:hypothetical protein